MDWGAPSSPAPLLLWAGGKTIIGVEKINYSKKEKKKTHWKTSRRQVLNKQDLSGIQQIVKAAW